MSEIDNSTIIKNNDIGDCLKDFEILQVLGKGAFGYVAKVKSKKNLKIYAMKKNDLSMIDDDDIKKYYENEGIFMKKLDHPNICKLYTSFKENNSVYLIMEYMDSGDLFTFLDAYKKLGEYISEEKLCIIFLQCLSSLEYIHSLGVIHRDIKPANFLYNSNGEVKLSDFNVSALQNIENAMFFTKDEIKKEELINRFTQIGSGKFQAPEINDEENYDTKVDIYSMGVTFCTVAFFKLEIPNDQNIKNIFSEELLNIIASMMRNNPKERPSSKELFDSLNKFYIEKFVHNTGLISCINCLSTYDSFKKYFLKDGYKINPLNEISFQFNDVIRSFNNSNMRQEEINSTLYKFKNLIINYGIRKNEDACSEIEPISIISFLLNKLHGELNTIKVNLGREDNYLRNYVNSNNKKDDAYLNYLIFYNTNFKSIISDNFFGLIKTKRLCNDCGDIKYSFNMQSFIPFNVSILIEYWNKKQSENKNLDIYYCFDCLNKNFILLKKNLCVACENCGEFTEHNEFKQFYSLPKNLIIFFDRGDNYKDSDFINFEEKLNLNQNYVEKFKTNYTYDLLGIICKVNEINTDDSHNKKFISFTKYKKGYINNNDKNKVYNINAIKDKNKYTVIGLFYYCKDVKSYIYNETIKKYLEAVNKMNNMNNNNNFNENNFNDNNNFNIMTNNMNNINNINDNNLNYNNINNTSQNNMNSMNNINMNNMNIDNINNMNNMNNNNMKMDIDYMNNNNMNNNNMNNNNMKMDIDYINNNNMNNNNMNNNNLNNNNLNNNNMSNNNFKSEQYYKNNISISVFKNESNNNELSQNNMNNFNNSNNNGFNQNNMVRSNINQNNMNYFNNNNNGLNQNNMVRSNINQNNMNYFNNNNNGFNQNNMMRSNINQNNMNNFNNNNNGFNQNNMMNNNNNYNNGFNQNNMMNNNNNGFNQNNFNSNFVNQNNMNNSNSYKNMNMNFNNNNNQLNSNQQFN